MNIVLNQCFIFLFYFKISSENSPANSFFSKLILTFIIEHLNIVSLWSARLIKNIDYNQENIIENDVINKFI